jgi:hypothetical protein
MKKTKIPNIKISEENKMDPEKMKDFISQKGIPKPIIEFNEKKAMPLYIFIANLIFLSATNINIMATIMHIKKTNKLEIRGRIRYETTGIKTEFTGKKTYKPEEIDKAKEFIKKFYKDMLNDLPLVREIKQPTEINFEINEELNKILQKMNDSNEFNIGISEKKKKTKKHD